MLKHQSSKILGSHLKSVRMRPIRIAEAVGQRGTIMTRNRSEAGITLVETMMAGLILILGSLSMVGLMVRSITTNNRNKMDSTQMMLATSIAEQIDSTIIGSGTSTLTDCAA